jgi:hypothetical protein
MQWNIEKTKQIKTNKQTRKIKQTKQENKHKMGEYEIYIYRGRYGTNMEQHSAHREIRLLPAMHMSIFVGPCVSLPNCTLASLRSPIDCQKLPKTKKHRNKWDYLVIS